MLRVVTTTSRPQREGEKDGVDYHFISKEEFSEKIKNNEFLEYVEYGGNLYGTGKDEISRALRNNQIWRIDPSRAGRIRQFIKESFDQKEAEELLNKVLVIYLTVDDTVVLERLKKRRIKEDEIQKRMEQDKKFWESFKDSYDFIVENTPGDLGKCVSEVIKIIQNHN